LFAKTGLQLNQMTPDDVLRQYPGPVRLQASMTLNVGLPAVCAVGCMILIFGDDYRVRAIGIVLGGFSLLYAIANYFTPPIIELAAGGFTATSYGGAKVRRRWSDVSHFSVGWGRFPTVSYEDAKSGNVEFLSFTSAFSAEQMAALMNAWRERSLSG
jgi:hypothetical protein